jgi:hypothetical protein
MKKIGSAIATAAIVGASALMLMVGTASATALPQIRIALDGRSISISGALESGAVSIQSTVTKVNQAEPTLVRLEPGVTFAQAFNAAQSHHGDPNYLRGLASLVFDVNANRGVSTAETTLQPGHYVALDTEGNNPAKWPRAEFDVTQASAPAALPKANATIATIDFNFRAPRTLHVGQLVRFENDGFLVHMVSAIGVKNQGDAKRLTALLLAGKDNQAQKLGTTFAGFAGPLSPGGMQQFVLNAKPGIYVLACFMDTQDNREHTQLGMERTIRIVK